MSGITSALYSAISGLEGGAQAMTVTGNNISNSNTMGFKSSTASFSDLLSASIASSSGGSQVGRGSQVQAVETNFSQGGFQSTSSPTDLAIEGSGFFIVHNPSNTTNLYTRNGAFTFDDAGYLVNADGDRIQGSSYNASGLLASGNLGDIKVDHIAQIPAKQTSTVSLQTNLDSNSSLVGPFVNTNANATSNYSTATTIYDSLGTAHQATCYFTKTGDNAWNWNLGVDGSDLTGGTAGTPDIVGKGSLTFNTDGTLATGGTPPTITTLPWNNGASQSQQIAYTFNPTQFNTTSTVFSQNQDGYTSGQVTSVNVGTDGVVNAVYSNGETIAEAKIALATFNNTGGLAKAGNSLYTSTPASGTPTIGYPGPSQGTLITNSLELSNVDVATEMVNLITVQSNYSANSKVVTTVNEMLQQLINLKQ